MIKKKMMKMKMMTIKMVMMMVMMEMMMEMMMMMMGLWCLDFVISYIIGMGVVNCFGDGWVGPNAKRCVVYCLGYI